MMTIEMHTPNDYVGDLMGDLSSRRGHVEGMETGTDDTIIKAQVPMARAPDLRRAAAFDHAGPRLFHLEFSHYAEAPHSIQEKIIAQSKANKAAAEGA